MPFSKFIVIPIFVAFQAATVMLITPYIKIGPESIGGPALVTWISFQAWAVYFLAGCTLKMAGKTMVGYAGGMIASIAIFQLMSVFNNPMGGYWGGALAVFIIVILIISAEKIEILNFIPAWFIGAGAFFALFGMHKPTTMGGYMEIAIPEMIACVIGLAHGFCTVKFRGWYENTVVPAKEEAEELKTSA